mgnify:CR=1 FL=1
MKTQKLPILFAGLIILSIAVAVTLSISKAFGSIVKDEGAPVNVYKTYSLFASTTAETTIATTTTATSTNITAYFDSSGRRIDGSADVRGAKKVTVYFSSGGISGANTGTTTFSVQTSRDGTNWDNFNMLLSNVATSTTPTSVSSVQLPPASAAFPATTTVVYFLNPIGGYLQLRCVGVITGATEAGCAVGVTY